MNLYFFNGQAPQGDMLSMMLPMILMLGVFYFLIIRPQKKKEKKTKEMLNQIKVTDEILTIGGIHGKVVRIKDDTLFIESTPDKTKLQIERWAIKEITKQAETDEE